MTVTAMNKPMLYCPKCHCAYDEGVQRFCTDCGGRLLPAESTRSEAPKAGGVFTALLGKMPPSASEKRTASEPRMVKAVLDVKPKSDAVTEAPPVKVYRTEQEIKPKFEPAPPAETPAVRIVRPEEIPAPAAPVSGLAGDPIGRSPLSLSNPEILLGQTIKGRYYVTDIFGEEEDTLSYLALDKLSEDRKVIIRVLLEDGFGDEFSDRVFAEERVALLHIQHPNIAAVTDSGELPEGNIFLVGEFVNGNSLADILEINGRLDISRTARIVRQASYALSEAHQNGVLHRNLRPENIMLVQTESGTEQVKLVGFGVTPGEPGRVSLAYLAPEEIGQNISTFSSDTFALAAIAFRALTGVVPFSDGTPDETVAAQRRGLMVHPSGVRFDVPELVDNILDKALAFEPSERYPKARDFGEAFYNALTTTAPWIRQEKEAAPEPAAAEQRSPVAETITIPPIKAREPREETPAAPDIHISPGTGAATESFEFKAEAPAGKRERKRTARPAPSQTKNRRGLWVGLLVVGIAAVFGIYWGLWGRLQTGRPGPSVQPTNTAATAPAVTVSESPVTSAPSIEAPPPARQLTAPPNSVGYQNSRSKLSGDLAKNFLPFSVFYPKSWNKAEAAGNFLDVSKRADDGTPVEQLLITHYSSTGLFSLDRAEFPKLAEKSDADLKKVMGDGYRLISQGEATIQNGRWNAYEVKFEYSGEVNGKPVKIWGKRYWVPVQNIGARNGFVITLLGSSRSSKVKSVDDLGVKGELASVFESFEPIQK